MEIGCVGVDEKCLLHPLDPRTFTEGRIVWIGALGRQDVLDVMSLLNATLLCKDLPSMPDFSIPFLFQE